MIRVMRWWWLVLRFPMRCVTCNRRCITLGVGHWGCPVHAFDVPRWRRLLGLLLPI